MTNAIEQIELIDLDADQQQLAELIGLDKYRNLIKIYGGTSIYVPKPDSFVANARNELIKQEFTGYNFKELAKKYGLTEVWIRSIVSERIKEIKQKPVDGQLSLF